MATEPDSFVSRWSRRKAQAREAGLPPPESATPRLAPAPPPPPLASAADAPAEASRVADSPLAAPPPATPPTPTPTLADVAELTRSSDYSRFVARDVTPEVRNAALKKLFTDPQFNVMDGLDTYIDDYGKPDPLPPGMLRQMVQSQLLGLFDDEPKVVQTTGPVVAPAASTPATALPLDTPPHEDTDLQLQPDDAAGCPGADAGAEPDAARQH